MPQIQPTARDRDAENPQRVMIDFGDGVERECVLVRPGPEGSWLIRSPEGAEGYYSGPFKRLDEGGMA